MPGLKIIILGGSCSGSRQMFGSGKSAIFLVVILVSVSGDVLSPWITRLGALPYGADVEAQEDNGGAGNPVGRRGSAAEGELLVSERVVFFFGHLSLVSGDNGEVYLSNRKVFLSLLPFQKGW